MHLDAFTQPNWPRTTPPINETPATTKRHAEKVSRVLAMIREHKAVIKDLNIRTFLKAARVRKASADEADWRELVLFAILS
jgi:hypothetical protein